ncbi:hypothetical protein PHMEG_00019500 [Phytophthora megakarya]|uniref:Uncharacterized protein n=1 Tax=Phytophthora megakarya TaxID=4795 RepID=A0A225VSY0_9STRA|nr:hypothetical protein PHMEG_00019500 [Phytophthora megakarya]
MEQRSDTDAGDTNAPNSSTTATSSAGAVGTPRGLRARPMDSELRPWALYDLSGADAPRTLEEMKEYFRCFRWLRRKKIEGIEATALQTSWCAFIRRWNSMLASSDSLPTWLKEREDILAEHSLSDLRWLFCNNAWSPYLLRQRR